MCPLLPTVAVTLALFASSTGASLAATGWKLVWSDEFEQPDGSSPNSAKWVNDLGGGGWGNNELQTYTSRTNNARIENGQLVIEARQENFTGTDGIPRNYTSARLKTQGKVFWTYGRIEARLKVPRGQGLWPAFWMLGTNFPSAGWPNCGEIDIMENIGAEPAIVHGTIHGPGYSGGNGIGGGFTLPGGAAFADDFHVFAVEWTTNLLRWYVDTQLYFTVTPTNLPNGTQWVFTKPQFLLLNLAVGGNWPGNPNVNTTFPQRLTVDYVRVYALSNTVACGGNVLVNPGFEIAGLANWTTYGQGFNTQLGSSSNLPVHSGSNVFKVFGQFANGDNYSGLYRDVYCSPGESFTARGWALTPVGDSLAGDNTAWVEVTFRDAASNRLALYRSAVLNSNTPAGVWLDLAVTNQFDPTTFAALGSTNNLVAPAGTVSARYQVVFRQPMLAAGAVLFDDLALSTGNNSDLPVQASAASSANALTISFATFLGLPYEVRYKSNLSDSDWQVWTNVVGDGATRTVADTMAANQKFYHVVQPCD